jgi:site-specific DNA recombinase
VKEYIDDGYSGADMDRPGLEQMRQDLKADVFDRIYFLCNDRIAREVAHQLIIVDELRRHAKRIIINGRDYEENPENKLSLTMFGAFAEFERAKILERSKRGKLHRLRSGQVLGQGMSPYGYDYVSRTSTSNATLLVNEREAAIVRHIFEAFADGTPICGIARSLERQGIPTRLGRTLWDSTHLKTILQRHTYAGTRYYNTVTTITEPCGNGSGKRRRTYLPKDQSEWIGVKVPAIISPELFEKVQEKLRQNRGRYRRPPVQHLLGNLLQCGECGGAMFSYNRYYTRMTKEPRLGVYHKAAYTCIWRRRALAHDGGAVEKCHNSEIATHILESKVWELVHTSVPKSHVTAPTYAAEPTMRYGFLPSGSLFVIGLSLP